jgi:hypothetical protein
MTIKLGSLRKSFLLLALMFAMTATFAGSAFAMIWEPGPISKNIIDCRDPCVDACADYRTTWQSITCFFS